MQESIYRNHKQWKQIGQHNHLTLLQLIDEFIKRDEEFQRTNRRTSERTRRLRMDKTVIEQRAKQIEREKQNNAIALSSRFLEIEKRKKDNIESANRRWKQLEKEEQERKNLLALRVDNAKKQREKAFEKERSENLNRLREHIDNAVSKSAMLKRQWQQQEGIVQNEIATIKTRVEHIERLRQKAHIGAEQTMQTIDKRRQQKLQQSLRKFREQERIYEQETTALFMRINELEKMKERQKELLKQRNEKFRIDLERRKQTTLIKIKSDMKWKQEYVAKLKSKMSEAAKKRDSTLYESMENFATVQNKERQIFLRKQHALERERKKMKEKMEQRINKMSMRKEYDTEAVLDAIHRIDQKKKTQQKTENTRDVKTTTEPVQNEAESLQLEKAKTMLRFEQEAKEREKNRIRNEFQKLMGSFGNKSVTFST